MLKICSLASLLNQDTDFRQSQCVEACSTACLLPSSKGFTFDMAPSDLLLRRSLLSRDVRSALWSLAACLLLTSECLWYQLVNETTFPLAKDEGLPCALTEDFMKRIKVILPSSIF